MSLPVNHIPPDFEPPTLLSVVFTAVIICLLLLLTGCSPPSVIREPFEVKIPVPVPCAVSLPSRPVWELDKKEVINGSLFVQGNGALIEIEQRRAYADQLEAALTACTALSK